jgi:hypothetical protein
MTMRVTTPDRISFCGIAEDGTRLEGYFDGPMGVNAQLPARKPGYVSHWTTLY